MQYTCDRHNWIVNMPGKRRLMWVHKESHKHTPTNLCVYMCVIYVACCKYLFPSEELHLVLRLIIHTLLRILRILCAHCRRAAFICRAFLQPEDTYDYKRRVLYFTSPCNYTDDVDDEMLLTLDSCNCQRAAATMYKGVTTKSFSNCLQWTVRTNKRLISSVVDARYNDIHISGRMLFVVAARREICLVLTSYN